MCRPSSCNHEDYPCCGCGNESSQEEQQEQFESLRNPNYDGPMGIFSGMDDAGMGTDEDYGHYGDDTPLGDFYGGG